MNMRRRGGAALTVDAGGPPSLRCQPARRDHNPHSGWPRTQAPAVAAWTTGLDAVWRVLRRLESAAWMARRLAALQAAVLAQLFARIDEALLESLLRRPRAGASPFGEEWKRGVV